MLRAQAVSRLAAYRQSHLICRSYSAALESKNKNRGSSAEFIGSDRREDSALGRCDDGPNSIFVRTLVNPRNPVDCLAIVQYLERAFGPVNEFMLGKYGDRMNNRFYIRFRDEASAARACEYTRTFKIPAPPRLAHTHPEGGMSLAELTSVLDVKFQEPELEPVQVDTEGKEIIRYDEAPEFLLFQIAKTRSFYHANPRRKRAYLTVHAAGSFVKWGGFADIKPLPSDVLLYDQGNKVDHPSMRAVLRKYANELKIPNPLALEGVKQGPVAADRSELRGTSVPLDSFNSESTASNVSQHSFDATDVDWEPIDFESEIESANPDISATAPTSDESSPSESTTTQTPVTAPQHAAPIPSAAPAPPSKSTSKMNTPEASAQLRAAGDILRKLNRKQQKSKVAAAPVPRPEKRKDVRAKQSRQTSFLETQADATSSVNENPGMEATVWSTSTSTQKHPADSEIKTKEQGVASRLKSFIGNWF